MTCQVVHCKKAPFDVYIGRKFGGFEASKWANPFVIGKHGTRTEVIAKYREWIVKQPAFADLSELRGKTLGCWCKGTEGFVDVPCHGDVLKDLLAEQAAETVVNDLLGDPIIPVFSSHYSYNRSILTLEEAGKTRPGNPVSICDLAKEHALKQVVVCDDRIDGLEEAQKNLAKPFKATSPKTLADYEHDLQGTKDKLSDEDKIKAQRLLDEATAKYVREKSWSTEPNQLVYGLKLVVVPDMKDKSPESSVNESKIIVFMRDAKPAGKEGSPSRADLIRLNNRAWTDGLYEDKQTKERYGRIDWATLKSLWTPNLSLALPFFSSFIARNLLTMATIIPDLPATPTLFKEVDSELPFASLIDEAVDRYATAHKAPIQRVKSIYYRDSAAFTDYVNFRARSTKSKGKSGTFSAPGVDNLASDRFSWQAYQELTR